MATEKQMHHLKYITESIHDSLAEASRILTQPRGDGRLSDRIHSMTAVAAQLNQASNYAQQLVGILRTVE